MNYETLMNMSLHSLADIALTEAFAMPVRLACFEALNARVHECEKAWHGFRRAEQVLILAALALDLTNNATVATVAA